MDPLNRHLDSLQEKLEAGRKFMLETLKGVPDEEARKRTIDQYNEQLKNTIEHNRKIIQQHKKETIKADTSISGKAEVTLHQDEDCDDDGGCICGHPTPLSYEHYSISADVFPQLASAPEHNVINPSSKTRSIPFVYEHLLKHDSQ